MSGNVDCPYCITGKDCPLHRKENRMQKIVLTVELLFEDGAIQHDSQAVDLLKDLLSYISQQTTAKDICGRVSEHGRQGVGKIAKEILGRARCDGGEVTGGTNREIWRDVDKYK